MKVGVIGLGRIGLPIALAYRVRGHDVLVFDKCEERQNIVKTGKYNMAEAQVEQLLESHGLSLVTLEVLVADSEIIFLAVNTPHMDIYQGHIPVDANKVLPDYSYHQVQNAIADVIKVRKNRSLFISILSTCSPGAIEEHVKPMVKDLPVQISYTPELVQLGVVIENALDPEFYLIGCDNAQMSDKLVNFYKSLNPQTHQIVTSVKNCEMIKIAEESGCNADVVTDALMHSKRKLWSPMFFKGAVAPGGACFPRDAVVFQALTQKYGIESSLARGLVKSRDESSRWFAKLIVQESSRLPSPPCPIWIMGTGFKKDLDNETGSTSLLIKHILEKEMGIDNVHVYDPLIKWRTECIPPTPAVFFIAMNHSCFQEQVFPSASIVLDPWGITFRNPSNVEIIHIGRHQDK